MFCSPAKQHRQNLTAHPSTAHSRSCGLHYLLGNSCMYFIHCIKDWVYKSGQPTHTIEVQSFNLTVQKEQRYPVIRGETFFSPVCFVLGLGGFFGLVGWFVCLNTKRTLRHWQSRLHPKKRNQQKSFKWQKQELTLMQWPYATNQILNRKARFSFLSPAKSSTKSLSYSRLYNYSTCLEVNMLLCSTSIKYLFSQIMRLTSQSSSWVIILNLYTSWRLLLLFWTWRRVLGLQSFGSWFYFPPSYLLAELKKKNQRLATLKILFHHLISLVPFIKQVIR